MHFVVFMCVYVVCFACFTVRECFARMYAVCVCVVVVLCAYTYVVCVCVFVVCVCVCLWCLSVRSARIVVWMRGA